MAVRSLIILICVSWCFWNVDTRVKVNLGTISNVIGFAEDVYSFFDMLLGKEDENEPAEIDYMRIIEEISAHIRMSTSTIMENTEIAAQLADLKRCARTIAQLVKDMEQIVNTTDQEKREERIKQFKKAFENERTDLHGVKTFLTVTVPGISSSLLSLIVDKVDCGMSALEDFQRYYMNNLVSKVIALDLAYERFESGILYNDKLTEWITNVKILLEKFENEKERCKKNFFKLAKTIFYEVDDPRLLSDKIQERFSHRQNDVFSLRGSYCIKKLKNYENIFLKQDGNGSRTVAVFGDKTTHLRQGSFEKLSKTRYDRCKSEYETQKMIDLFSVLDYEVLLWLMFPANQSENFVTFLDQNTTANIGFTTQNNEEYKIFIYVRKQNSTIPRADDYETYFRDFSMSTAASLVPKWWCFILLIVTRCLHTHFFK